MKNVREIFGDIDIYLFDQIQKGRFAPGMNILDAGCGGGRNVIYFMRMGCNVSVVDRNAEAVEQVKRLARTLAPDLPLENFQIAAVEKMSFPDKHFDCVISSAVLHFAENKEQFDQMLKEMWRVLKPNGMLFARLASSIGIEDLIAPTGNGRYKLPDGSERFLVNEDFLMTATENLGGQFLEPIKTTNVQNLRCMTTWVLQKHS
ncbi:MAG TPA: class I SAM-dependent methyltransferase [Pyrinomonadaceae bacterium]|nr:class I SAM-dependent methyltransferase [Pyrinomonadaceae bacterium]